MSALGDIAHVIVDGSNIATEGRSLPSLSQLNDAVMAFIEDHPDAAVTVVVDATFGHRIDKSEVEAFEEGVSNNELVAPPAGAVGRGDAFVLQIADKANDVIYIPDLGDHLTAILATVPLQLLAYHIAVLKGTDVDQPRNLAKSVTVE